MDDKNFFIPFQVNSVYPNTFMTADNTSNIAGGGEFIDFNSSRFCFEIPLTAFLASSINGWTSLSSDSTFYFEPFILSSSDSKYIWRVSVSFLLFATSSIAFWICYNAISASDCFYVSSIFFFCASLVN